MPEFDTLYTLAEIAVALAGFAAIVVLFKRDDSGRWELADADRFNGMLLHAMAAGFFCILPPLVSVFTSDASLVWTIGSIAIGTQIVAHSWKIFWLPSSTFLVQAFLVVPLGVVILQLLNATGVIYSGEFSPYLVGVLWHVFQSGLLFVSLVFVRASDTQHSDG